MRFQDGAIIEIARAKETSRPVSNGMAARVAGRLGEAMEKVDPLTSPICDHVRKVAAANGATAAEVKLGLSFTAEGDLYIVKGTGEVSVEIKFTLTPKAKS